MKLTKVNNKEYGIMTLNNQNEFRFNHLKVITHTLGDNEPGFKFPLMLIGIGLAFCYQLFCRDQSPKRNGRNKFSQSKYGRGGRSRFR